MRCGEHRARRAASFLVLLGAQYLFGSTRRLSQEKKGFSQTVATRRRCSRARPSRCSVCPAQRPAHTLAARSLRRASFAKLTCTCPAPATAGLHALVGRRHAAQADARANLPPQDGHPAAARDRHLRAVPPRRDQVHREVIVGRRTRSSLVGAPLILSVVTLALLTHLFLSCSPPCCSSSSSAARPRELGPLARARAFERRKKNTF